MKSEPWWQKWQELHFYRGSELCLLFPPFTGVCLILQDFTEGYKGFSALQVLAFLLQMEKTQSVLAECLASIWWYLEVRNQLNRELSLILFSYRGLQLHQCGLLSNKDLVVFIAYHWEELKIKLKVQSKCKESLLPAQKFSYSWKGIWSVFNIMKENRLSERYNGSGF